jgi:hypothetical protein
MLSSCPARDSSELAPGADRSLTLLFFGLWTLDFRPWTSAAEPIRTYLNPKKIFCSEKTGQLGKETVKK